MANDDRRGDDRDGTGVDWRSAIRLVLMVVLLAIVVALGIANAESVPVDYLLDTREIPLVWVIVLSLLAGAVLERMYLFLRGRRRD